MGSTGSGSFSDYSRHKPTNSEGANGGSSGKDKCGEAFSCSLEEVGRCFYFINYGNVPPVETEVFVSFNGVRLVVENKLKEEIGYLPTKFNYIKYCLDDKFKYGGTVTASSITSTPSVNVDIVPLL
ncbi:hypothetical protein [Chitinophaga defluvii]|uniref:Uncharacterized protein n=1 Tax=Chitinophaga defluvii TaxID=3163343 RepID=A0ABV2T2P4_9BACT